MDKTNNWYHLVYSSNPTVTSIDITQTKTGLKQNAGRLGLKDYLLFVIHSIIIFHLHKHFIIYTKIHWAKTRIDSSFSFYQIVGLEFQPT
jgi:hypothetical protein